MRYFPGGHVVSAECHHCGVKANDATVALLDAQFRHSATSGLALGGTNLD
jgi:hypothetical protein